MRWTEVSSNSNFLGICVLTSPYHFQHAEKEHSATVFNIHALLALPKASFIWWVQFHTPMTSPADLVVTFQEHHLLVHLLHFAPVVPHHRRYPNVSQYRAICSVAGRRHPTSRVSDCPFHKHSSRSHYHSSCCIRYAQIPGCRKDHLQRGIQLAHGRRDITADGAVLLERGVSHFLGVEFSLSPSSIHPDYPPWSRIPKYDVHE